MLEGWAIVDNTSGEDWKGVLVGVGASSALSFRYDLWSVRQIERELLAGRRAVRGRAADRACRRTPRPPAPRSWCRSTRDEVRAR